MLTSILFSLALVAQQPPSPPIVFVLYTCSRPYEVRMGNDNWHCNVSLGYFVDQNGNPIRVERYSLRALLGRDIEDR